MRNPPSTQIVKHTQIVRHFLVLGKCDHLEAKQYLKTILNQFAVKFVEKTAEKYERGTLETLDKRLIVCFEKLTKTL